MPMGQAKNRGNQAQRIEQALARERAKLPSSVKCNSCQADLTDITPMDTRGMAGIDIAGAAECHPCGCTTWALHGNPADVESQLSRLQQIYGAGIAGVALKDGLPSGGAL